jgi:hypothetical protein
MFIIVTLPFVTWLRMFIIVTLPVVTWLRMFIIVTLPVVTWLRMFIIATLPVVHIVSYQNNISKNYSDWNLASSSDLSIYL